MIPKDLIRKSIELAIIAKCPTSSKARKRGRGGVQHGSSNPFENDTNDEYDITYPDGTKIVFSTTDDIKSLTIDGVEYPYLMDDSYDNFNYQTEKLRNSNPVEFKFKVRSNDRAGNSVEYENLIEFEDDWDFLTQFADKYASFDGLSVNKSLLNGGKLTEYGRTLVYNKLSHDYFVELERNTPVDNANYVTLRYISGLHKNDSLDKLQYTTKGHTSLSTGGDIEDLESTFSGGVANNRYRQRGYTDTDTYKVYTYIKKDSGVKGLYLGNALNASRGTDWESELNLPPGTRFERDLIDEERHIIIQHVIKQ